MTVEPFLHCETKKVEAEILLKDGTVFVGNLYSRKGERVSDILNDGRQFVPIETASGEVVILGKDTIARVSPRDVHANQKQRAGQRIRPVAALKRSILDGAA